jgi:hypothetical protein
MLNLLTPDIAFHWANLIVLPAWIGLAISLFVPRFRLWIYRLTGLFIPLLLGSVYGWLIFVASQNGTLFDFSSLKGVQSLMQNPYALVAGWLHYLAFDLFIGTELCKRGHESGFSPWLLLLVIVLCFIFGPLGLVLYGLMRGIYHLTGGAKS